MVDGGGGGRKPRERCGSNRIYSRDADSIRVQTRVARMCAPCARRRCSAGFESRGAAGPYGRRRCTFPNIIIFARGIVRVFVTVGLAYALAFLFPVLFLRRAVYTSSSPLSLSVVAAADFLVSMLTHSAGRADE